jgi:predicted secreted protein
LKRRLRRMNRKFTVMFVALMLLAAVCPCAHAAGGWSKTYGGTGEDIGYGQVIQTSDGGYAVSGDTASFGAGGDDAWLIKTDATGNMIWNKTYGGVLDEFSHGMCQTNDGGYAFSGYTKSFGAGGQDAWLVKTDSSGNMQWNKTYGGTGNEIAANVIQTSDGGYAMSGWTESFGAGLNDSWLIKTDAAGNMQWNKTYGGADNEAAYEFVQTGDGGYTITATTKSFGAGGFDGWLIKTDANGNMQWNKTYGGAGDDSLSGLVRTSDGGYAMSGYTASFGGFYKFYVVKTDANGNMQWENAYGKLYVDFGIHIVQTADGGTAIIGFTYTTVGTYDFWLIKTDAGGSMQWDKTYGGAGNDYAMDLIQTSDGGYAMSGWTESFGAGGNDFWLVKTDALGVIPEGLTIGVMLTLSTIAVIVSTRYFRKRPRIEKCGQIKR